MNDYYMVIRWFDHFDGGRGGNDSELPNVDITAWPMVKILNATFLNLD